VDHQRSKEKGGTFLLQR